MSKRLTIKSIEALKPSDARREVPDGEVRGLYLVVQPSGAKSYVLRYRASGRPRKLTIGSGDLSLGEVRKIAAAARVAIANGRDPAAEKQQKKAIERATSGTSDLVEAVVAEFIERHVKRETKPLTAREYIRLLKKEVAKPWRGRRFPEITRRDVNLLLDKIVDRGSPVAANRVFAVLRKLCRWAVAREIIQHSPCEGIEARTAEQARDRVLSDAELKAVWLAADKVGWPFGHVTKLLLLTGQRRGEVAGMTWKEIDLKAAVWTIPAVRAKNGRQHVVPLSSPVLDILKGIPQVKNAGDLVFPRMREKVATGKPSSKPTAISGFSAAKSRLDAAIQPAIPPWSFHDLRRSCASGLARLGIDLPVIERCLNHVSGSFGGIVSVYQHHKYENETRQAIDAWGRHVESLITGRPTNVVLIATAQGAA